MGQSWLGSWAFTRVLDAPKRPNAQAWPLSVSMASSFFANLFYYSAYFCYNLWVSLHFFVLFMSPTVLFQLIFTFIYSTFNKKFSVSTK